MVPQQQRRVSTIRRWRHAERFIHASTDGLGKSRKGKCQDAAQEKNHRTVSSATVHMHAYVSSYVWTCRVYNTYTCARSRETFSPLPGVVLLCAVEPPHCSTLRETSISFGSSSKKTNQIVINRARPYVTCIRVKAYIPRDIHADTSGCPYVGTCLVAGCLHLQGCRPTGGEKQRTTEG